MSTVRTGANCGHAGSHRGLGCQRALPWPQSLPTGMHMAVEAGDRSQAGGMCALLERLALSTCMVVVFSRRV